MEFHHNWVHNLNDDGIIVAGDARTPEREDLLQRGDPVPDRPQLRRRPGRARLHLRQPDRPPPPTLGNPPRKTGVPRLVAARPLLQGRSRRGTDRPVPQHLPRARPGGVGEDLAGMVAAGFAHYVNIDEGQPRRAFNNIFVAVYTHRPSQADRVPAARHFFRTHRREPLPPVRHRRATTSSWYRGNDPPHEDLGDLSGDTGSPYEMGGRSKKPAFPVLRRESRGTSIPKRTTFACPDPQPRHETPR